MTPSPPDEALHFRGKTLTPESPRPLHIPEPSNIPVLENQMDPVFNDTSTYERSVYKQAPQTHDGWLHGGSKDGQGGPSQTQGAGSFHGSQPNRGVQNEMIASAYYSPPNPASGSENTGHLGSGLSPPDSTYSHTAPVAPVSQGFATGSEVDPAHKPEQSRMSDRLIAEERVGHKAGGVNFQQLLDNLSRPNPGATIPVTSSAGHSSLHQAPAGESLKSQGIPAHPQAQSHDSVQAHYMPNGEVAYHQLPSAHDAAATASPAYSAQPSNTQAQTQPQPIDTSSSGGASVNLPPPIATFPQPPSTCAEPHGSLQEPSVASKKGRAEKRSIKPADDDSPWGPEIQKKYDEFLHDERIYVTEGLWDRFPVGSRLFVGNLPTERVTKRDMFHIFHDYGKLAQISIKQAYGFIQFLEASSCHEALSNEQGAVVRGRKIHLEISKPQRSTRPAQASEDSRAPPPRRSRSPEFNRAPPGRTNARAPVDRYDRSKPYETNRVPFSDFRDEPSHRSRRDDYRPPRSPSPRPFRGSRDGYRSRDRTPERFDRRERRRSRSPRSSRSPYSRDRRYRSISPRPRGIYEGEADLPVPRRAQRDVPEVQLLVLEELDRNFVLHVENAFRNRGLRVDVLVLGPRIPLGAAVHRQFIEGVLAVVRLSRPNQVSRKIPLQLFDRTAGLDNVRFLDYPELEPNMSAELLSHQSQAMQRGAAPTAFAPNPGFIIPPAQPMSVPQPGLSALSNPPNIANLISSLDGPSLSTLLSALQRPPHSQPVSATQSPFSSPNPPPADLASLLTNAHRPQPMQTTAQQPLPHPPFNLQPVNAPVITDPTLLSFLAKGLGGQQQQGQGPVGAQVQNLMQHLAKWKQ
ncbi:hypothetical protein DTO013E5_1795 [Penicillium roqueforti]|uniref:Anticodon-binding n=1 Tax=Penicillium roqueforti (strain FM164) TaxID=1365484 RepID=W6QC72_PENRF|nr:uncharacterized protein LCP9604111_2595 [Penicillium roqueforti]CDM34070.1 Anticodon-binding [Penicillium roqueforti FM164]KAF9251194.1 hypothetical protein LCP9604111_2595 [Penicillium roqueforti]KAI1837947.1 hypothetical protein CBS147337_1170 [Penicillium roqueforti]KAI2678637.1 hypothetical protein CBS147355_4522 [Penicillium roqueforti]KAI2718819.1 hypothetical protein CBS147318_3929 [Penicillium roqueforti]